MNVTSENGSNGREKIYGESVPGMENQTPDPLAVRDVHTDEQHHNCGGLWVLRLIQLRGVRFFKAQPFTWWVINYSIEDGGLGAFLAFGLSFAISQTFNFFLQRKTTFKANNNVLYSGIMYAIMVIGVYFLQLWVPSVIQAGIAAAIGATLGATVVKFINMTISMLIQFPMNKWVIMRNNTMKPLENDID